MPNITITEVDKTSAGTVLMAEDVVFIPGFVNKDYLEELSCEAAYAPRLCETIQDFETYFGPIPATFAADQTYPTGRFPEEALYTNTMFKKDMMDPGYVYAKELLAAGLPVLYERINETAEDITVAHMYEVLSEASAKHQIWNNLKDMGEYQEVKYITSGGYPTFEYNNGEKSYTIDTKDIVVEAANFDFAAFQRACASSGITTDAKLVFKAILKYINKTIIYATVADMEAAKEAVEVGNYGYVKEENKLYQLKMVGEPGVRTWVNVICEFNWTVSIDDTTPTQTKITDWGFSDLDPINGSEITVNYQASPYSVIVNKMLDCAATRGDCVALIDHTENRERTLVPTDEKSVYYSISNDESCYKIKTNGEFGAMFTPWCGYTYTSTLRTKANADAIAPVAMPASFGYLTALAKSIKTNANWLAVAGAARGGVNVTDVKLSNGLRLSNAIADAYQPRTGIAINPITNIKPYGYIIWGNRTLKANVDNLTATSFLNTRNLVSDVKKMAYITAKRCMFEQNSDILWLSYKSKVSVLLNSMVSGQGLAGYKLIKGTTDEKAKLVCTIRLYPLYAVESFEINVELSDDEVTIS